MRKASYSLLAGALMAIGCNNSQNETSTSAADESEQQRFTKEVISLKQTTPDRFELNDKIAELTESRYKTLKESSVEAYRKAINVENSETMAKYENRSPLVDQAAYGPEPLAKSSSACPAGYPWQVKDWTDNTTISFDGPAYFVPAGQTIQVRAKANGSSDPFTCITREYPNEIHSAYFEACNDDWGGYNDPNFSYLSSVATWTNSTGAGRWVSFYVNSYSTTSSGTSDIQVILNGATVLNSPGQPIAGIYARYNNLGDSNYGGGTQLIVNFSQAQTYWHVIATPSTTPGTKGMWYWTGSTPSTGAVRLLPFWLQGNVGFVTIFKSQGTGAPSGTVNLKQWDKAPCPVGL